MKRQQGFSAVAGILAIVIVAVVGFAAWRVYDSHLSSTDSQNQAARVYDHVIWKMEGDKWVASKPAPDCEEPIELEFPSDITTATAALWPGQIRGEFKAHGGVRYNDSVDGKVEIRAPYDGYIFRVGRYDFDFSGEPQVVFDVINNCGIMYRMDHVNELSDNIKSILDNFPGDGSTSAMYDIPPVAVKKGDVLATSIGFPLAGNVFYDLGVYDLRQKNESAQDPEWAAAHLPELAHYGVCWFDLMPQDINDTLRNLPTGKEGKASDYCTM